MSTTIGLLHLELHVTQATSLKDKRRIVKSFKDRVRARYNVSAAEVASQDLLRRASLAVAMVGNDRRYIEGALQKIRNLAAMYRDVVVIEEEIEWL
jgi:hypothetical protein